MMSACMKSWVHILLCHNSYCLMLFCLVLKDLLYFSGFVILDCMKDMKELIKEATIYWLKDKHTTST